MKLLSSFAIAALLVTALITPAAAAPSIDWDPVFTWEPGATATNSPAGGFLSGVGLVSAFGPPLQFLDATDPTKEYTIYIHSLKSLGTQTSGPPSNTFYTTHYTGGFIEIYEDNSPDANFGTNPPNATVPSTFTDGTLILAGQFTSFYTQTNNFTTFQTGNMEGEIQWTGGQYQNLMVDAAGRPCPGLFTGGITWRSSVVPQGYIFRHDGKIDNNCPVPVENGTWGRIKSSYR